MTEEERMLALVGDIIKVLKDLKVSGDEWEWHSIQVEDIALWKRIRALVEEHGGDNE